MRSEKIVAIKDIIEKPLGKDDPANNPKSKEFIKNLAKSIKVDGLIHPPLLIPDPGNEGKYLIVAGRGRLKAIRDELKEEVVRATVDDELTFEDAYAATLGENLWRTEVSKSGKNKARYFKAVQAWWDHYNKRTAQAPATPPPAPAEAPQVAQGDEEHRANLAREGDEPQAEASEPATPFDPLSVTEVPPTAAPEAPKVMPGTGVTKLTETEEAFVDDLVAQTGQAKRSAYRTLRLIKAFTPEQLDLFEAKNASQQTMEILALDDPAHRDAAFALWATGMAPADAVEKTRPGDGPKPDTALTDDEWVEKYCGDLLARLAAVANKLQFLAAAGRYRRLRSAMDAFRQPARKDLASTPGRDRFSVLVGQLCYVAHPKDWLLCGGCNGKGIVGPAACPKCGGGGFVLKVDKQ